MRCSPWRVGAQMGRHIKLTRRVKTLARQGLKKVRQLLAADAEPTSDWEPELDIRMLRAALRGGPTALVEYNMKHKH